MYAVSIHIYDSQKARYLLVNSISFTFDIFHLWWNKIFFWSLKHWNIFHTLLMDALKYNILLMNRYINQQN